MTLRWKIAQALEIRWWRRYLKDKETADYLAAKKAYWQRILKTLQIDIQPNEQILDAGCGPAGIFMILNRNAVDAVDPLLSEYETNLLHFKKDNYSNVHFYNKSLEKFNIEKSYDTVFCLNAINHVADLNLCLNKLVAATAQDGRLIISIDVHKSKVLKAIFRAIPGDVLHPHQHDLQDYIKMLEQRGCKIVKTVCLKPGRIFDYVAIICVKVF
jgi:2-polyprenyl-3-methyl-5-hydroxy-6-metoxy-1,4-benzoquinol methylase